MPGREQVSQTLTQGYTFDISRTSKRIAHSPPATSCRTALFTPSIAAAVPVAFAIFLGPACNAALFGYQAAITPDRLQGRVVSVIFLGATSAAAAAPILAGTFVTAWNGPATLLLFAAGVAASAVAATLSRGIRTMRPIEEAATTA
jgi:hypothetical protein